MTAASIIKCKIVCFLLFISPGEVPYSLFFISCFSFFSLRFYFNSYSWFLLPFLLFFLFTYNAFKVQLGRRMHVCRIKDSVETIKRFGMGKWSKGETVYICIAPERLPHTSKASGKGSQQSDCTPGHKTPTMCCFLLLTLLRHGEKAIKAFIGFALKICSQQLKIITNQIKIEVAQTTIRPRNRLDLCYCKRTHNDW